MPMRRLKLEMTSNNFRRFFARIVKAIEAAEEAEKEAAEAAEAAKVKKVRKKRLPGRRLSKCLSDPDGVNRNNFHNLSLAPRPKQCGGGPVVSTTSMDTDERQAAVEAATGVTLDFRHSIASLGSQLIIDDTLAFRHKIPDGAPRVAKCDRVETGPVGGVRSTRFIKHKRVATIDETDRGIAQPAWKVKARAKADKAKAALKRQELKSQELKSDVFDMDK